MMRKSRVPEKGGHKEQTKKPTLAEKIAEFFEPTAKLSVIHKTSSSSDTYTKECAEKVKELYGLLEEGELDFRKLLKDLSIWRSKQKKKKFYSKLRTRNIETPIRSSPPYDEIYKYLVKFVACTDTKTVATQHHYLSGIKLTTNLKMQIEEYGALFPPHYCIEKSVIFDLIKSGSDGFQATTGTTSLKQAQTKLKSSKKTTGNKPSFKFMSNSDFSFLNSSTCINKDTSNVITLTTITIDVSGKATCGWNIPQDGIILHTEEDYLDLTSKLLSKLFRLCCAPMKDTSPESKSEKLREIATFEWVFQQASLFSRGTPTIAKVIISALLLKHGFKPIHSCAHNDMNCFLSFILNLNEYLKSWPKYTPYVDNNFSLINQQSTVIQETGNEEKKEGVCGEQTTTKVSDGSESTNSFR